MYYNIDKQLIDFKKNIYSQSGEDGILEEIINRLGNKSDKVCCGHQTELFIEYI